MDELKQEFVDLATKLLAQNDFWELEHMPGSTKDAVKALLSWMKLYAPD